MKRRLFGFVLGALILSAATVAGAQTSSKEEGFGRLNMRTVGVRTKAQHQRVLAKLWLTPAQKEAVAAADRKSDAALMRWQKPYWDVPYSQIPAEEKGKLSQDGQKIYAQYKKDLRAAMGEAKYARYVELFQDEQLRFIHADGVEGGRREDGFRIAAQRRVLPELDLGIEKELRILELEKVYRAERHAGWQKLSRVSPAREGEADKQRRALRSRLSDLESNHDGALAKVMGDAKYQEYKALMTVALADERQKHYIASRPAD